MARIAIILGILAGLFWPYLLSLALLYFLLFFILVLAGFCLLTKWRWLVWGALLLFGFGFSQYAAFKALDAQLPSSQEGIDLLVEGRVASLPVWGSVLFFRPAVWWIRMVFAGLSITACA